MTSPLIQALMAEAQHPTLTDLLKLAKLADIKPAKAQLIIDQVVQTAQYMISIIDDYPIERVLRKQIKKDVSDNISRMLK